MPICRNEVQQKIPSLFKSVIVDEPSNKHKNQFYKVITSDEIKSEALQHHIEDAIPSEKIDGTSVFIREFQGKPWLWARHDRKLNKTTEKRFQKFQNQLKEWEKNGKEGSQPMFFFDIEQDFKEKPFGWIPSKNTKIVNNQLQPDYNGHIMGWVPVDPNTRTHCWHLSAVDLDQGLALVLRHPQMEDYSQLEIAAVPLVDLLDSTMELIGTHINGNPYDLGSKKHPLHLLIEHGSIGFDEKPPFSYHECSKWFQTTQEAAVEGIIWRCPNGVLYKLHRHHLNLPWPLKSSTRLNIKPVNIQIPPSGRAGDRSQFSSLSWFHRKTFENLSALSLRISNNI